MESLSLENTHLVVLCFAFAFDILHANVSNQWTNRKQDFPSILYIICTSCSPFIYIHYRVSTMRSFVYIPLHMYI